MARSVVAPHPIGRTDAALFNTNVPLFDWFAAANRSCLLAYREDVVGDAQAGKLTFKPIVGAGLAVLLTNLPDQMEPATHPNHRQFFHSVACAAYGVHLALDATTRKSLPFFGRL